MLVAELKSFYAVARCGTVTKAAAQLGVSQPTVTAQLRQLESRYGVELFHRQGRGLHLSEAGRRLMPQVEKLVQQETEIEFRLRDASDLREGLLRIGATGPFYIMETVQRYNQRYPGVDLVLTIGNSQSMLQALHDYRIEVATSSYLMQDAHLYHRQIASDPLRIVVHRSHPLASLALGAVTKWWMKPRAKQSSATGLLALGTGLGLLRRRPVLTLVTVAAIGAVTWWTQFRQRPGAPTHIPPAIRSR